MLQNISTNPGRILNLAKRKKLTDSLLKLQKKAKPQISHILPKLGPIRSFYELVRWEKYFWSHLPSFGQNPRNWGSACFYDLDEVSVKKKITSWRVIAVIASNPDGHGTSSEAMTWKINQLLGSQHKLSKKHDVRNFVWQNSNYNFFFFFWSQLKHFMT